MNNIKYLFDLPENDILNIIFDIIPELNDQYYDIEVDKMFNMITGYSKYTNFTKVIVDYIRDINSLSVSFCDGENKRSTIRIIDDCYLTNHIRKHKIKNLDIE